MKNLYIKLFVVLFLTQNINIGHTTELFGYDTEIFNEDVMNEKHKSQKRSSGFVARDDLESKKFNKRARIETVEEQKAEILLSLENNFRNFQSLPNNYNLNFTTDQFSAVKVEQQEDNDKALRSNPILSSLDSQENLDIDSEMRAFLVKQIPEFNEKDLKPDQLRRLIDLANNKSTRKDDLFIKGSKDKYLMTLYYTMIGKTRQEIQEIIKAKYPNSKEIKIATIGEIIGGLEKNDYLLKEEDPFKNKKKSKVYQF